MMSEPGESFFVCTIAVLLVLLAAIVICLHFKNEAIRNGEDIDLDDKLYACKLIAEKGWVKK